jgi:hypothetical protein
MMLNDQKFRTRVGKIKQLIIEKPNEDLTPYGGKKDGEA